MLGYLVGSFIFLVVVMLVFVISYVICVWCVVCGVCGLHGGWRECNVGLVVFGVGLGERVGEIVCARVA